MVEAGENLRLSLKPRQPIRISGKRLRQDLERHLPVQLGIGGLVDLPHASLADEGGDVVVAESGTDGQRHRCGRAAVLAMVAGCGRTWRGWSRGWMGK